MIIDQTGYIKSGVKKYSQNCWIILHVVVVVGSFILESPRKKDELAVAVNRVVENKLVLPKHGRKR